MALSSETENTTPAPKKAGGNKWVPLVVLAALVLGGVAWKIRSGGQAPKEDAAAARGPRLPVVRTVPVSTGNISSTLAVTGSLRSNQNLNLSSKISGRVARVHVDEGQRISRGQLLVSLETEDLRVSVASAQANLRSAQVRRQQAVSGLPGKVQGVLTTIDQAEASLATAQARYRQAMLNEPAQIQTAQAQVANSEETVKSAEARLAQARTTAKQTKEQVEAEIQGAQSLVESRKAALAEVRRGSRAQEIAQAEAQVRLAQATLNNAKTELNRAQILFDGGAAPRATLDNAKTTAETAQAQVDAAQQTLSLVREGSTNEQIRQAEENVAQSEAQLLNSQASRARIPVAEGEVTAALATLSQAQESLRTARANLAQVPITRQETRVAREAVEQARATLEGARANRSQIPVARQDIQAADAAVSQARAQLNQAQINLKNAQIYSPVSGVVNTKLADVGEAVGPTTALLNLVALDSVYFEAQVSENNVPLIRVGQPVKVSVPAVQQATLQGNVTEIIPVADNRSRQFRLRVTIPDPARRLTPGAFARGTVTTQAVNNTLTLPTEAVIRENGQPYVLLAVGTEKERVVAKRTVKTGLEAGGRTQILGGVKKGDAVIIGNREVTDKDKVQISQN